MRGGELFAFAGLWDAWKDKASGQELLTYTILTTDPNELLKSIHNRMPVIVARKDYERWMAPAEPSHLPVDLLRSYPAEEMKAWPVSQDVGNVRNNRPGLVEPVDLHALREASDPTEVVGSVRVKVWALYRL
jgi:putative SOS response-associated peptidase YedK